MKIYQNYVRVETDANQSYTIIQCVCVCVCVADD